MMSKQKEKEDDPNAEIRMSTWKKNFDYVLGMLGLLIGFGNLWRFPYLCYKHGGGAFVLAYWLIAIFLTFPTMILESALGQFTAQSPVRAWTIVPLFKGLGLTMTIYLGYAVNSYPLLLTWSLRWFVASFYTGMPWTTCGHEWNGENCYPLMEQPDLNNTAYSSSFNSSYQMNDTVGNKSSVYEFWKNNILGMKHSSGVDDPGGLNWGNFICLSIIWILTYFSVWKGISWSSKIVRFTATSPIALIFVVLIRGATLEGAGAGIIAYLKPDFVRMLDVELWTDAISQVLFSVGLGAGTIISMSAYNRYHHNFIRDSIILVILNGAVSFLSGFAIFSVIGYLSHVQNVSLSEVAESGPGLVFVIYPTALSLIPFPQVWCAMFFATLLLLGFDSQFASVESFMACCRELYPRICKHKRWREILAAVVCVLQYLVAIPMVTNGGMYVFNIINTYTMAGWCAYFIVLTEMVTIGWAYGADRMCQNIQEMVGYKIPRMWLIISWKYTGPCITRVLMVYYIAAIRPLTYESSYSYPGWAVAVGWFTILNISLCIPISIIYALWKEEGSTFVQKLKSSLTPKLYHTQGKAQDDCELDLFVSS